MSPVASYRTPILCAAAWLAASFAAFPAGAEPARQYAEISPPAKTAPGAAPSASRLIGTWTVAQYAGGPANGRSDRSESTTYRFEEGGRVTVAGAKQCAYSLDDAELKVDCGGRITAGMLEFPAAQTMVWTVGARESITLTKR